MAIVWARPVVQVGAPSIRTRTIIIPGGPENLSELDGEQIAAKLGQWKQRCPLFERQTFAGPDQFNRESAVRV